MLAAQSLHNQYDQCIHLWFQPKGQYGIDPYQCIHVLHAELLILRHHQDPFREHQAIENAQQTLAERGVRYCRDPAGSVFGDRERKGYAYLSHVGKAG